MDYMGDSGNPRPAGEAQAVTQGEQDYDQQGGQHGHQQANQQQANFAYQYQQPTQNRQDPYNMNSLSGALPNYAQDYQNPGGQRYPSNTSASAVQYQLQNMSQYGGLPAHSGANSPYNLAYSQYNGQYQQNPQHNLQAQVGVNSAGPFYNSPFIGQTQQHGQPFFVPQNQYIPQSPVFSNMPSAGHFLGRGGYPVDPRIQVQQRGNDLLAGAQNAGVQGRSSSVSSSTGRSSVVRGPPRKPRQSGHAIWIGNLPPQTDLMSLVLHVCKETVGLESLFLISKSNCAFANFKDEESCAAAQSKIHDSRFQTVRLVSRLRKSSVGTPTGVIAPTGPAALTPQSAPVARTPSPEDESDVKETATETVTSQQTGDATPPKDKYFVVKSLTVEDLDLSVRNGIWATQSHNEEALNKAYEAADSVYLIFSANKSGEYFGYARMISPINDDPAAAIEFAPKAQAVEDPELPKAIPTPASEFAPKGRIIDDSARGTIFWEVERDESEEPDVEDEEQHSSKSDGDDSTTPSKAWGKPFKIEWISTTRLPFYRTRGLRNPWNSNREVKIARDGTELETGVGRRLVGLFHRLPSPVVPQNHGVPLMMPGYPPHMRPYQ